MIDRFINTYEFLSNSYPMPHPSVEHHYQAAKTDDPALKAKIMNAPSPHEAKKLGEAVPLRKDWERVENKIMENLVRWKFSDPVLGNLLLQTGGEELLDGNYHGDAIGGCVRRGEVWVGENRNGKILMKIRLEVRKKGLS
jgi:ribA/ribD-fused uncharacterized protein